jgi:hypothetical protein
MATAGTRAGIWPNSSAQSLAKHAAILEFINSLRLSVPEDQKPKTRHVMNHLVRSSLRAK